MADKSDGDDRPAERDHFRYSFSDLPSAGVNDLSTNSLFFLSHLRQSLSLLSCDDNRILFVCTISASEKFPILYDLCL
jgi:hypothetical protein